MNEIVIQFFNQNPDASHCYVALGLAFADAGEAEKYTAGTAESVHMYDRKGLISDNSDALKSLLAEKELQISDLLQELSKANQTINELGGPEGVSIRIKNLTAELGAANNILADREQQIKELTEKLTEYEGKGKSDETESKKKQGK